MSIMPQSQDTDHYKETIKEIKQVMQDRIKEQQISKFVDQKSILPKIRWKYL